MSAVLRQHPALATAQAVLLLNLGSPTAPTPAALKSYLRRFLNDPRVVDLPWALRTLLVEGVIVPLRARRSARRYQAIWSDTGSPLDVHTAAQRDGLRARLADVEVVLAMRYGEPSIAAVIDELLRLPVAELIVVPLFPQYASATVGAAMTEVFRCLNARSFMPAVKVVAPFFADSGYIDAVAARIKRSLDGFNADHLLLSYHGLPVRQLKAATRATGGKCYVGDCCARLGEANFCCYRAQCYDTSRALTERLPSLPTSTVFQSRLRGTTWSGPHLEERIGELARQGVRRLAIACPGFVADNLETLYDVAIEARQAFLAAGGEALLAVPCVNDDRDWLDCLARLIRRAID